MAELLRQQGGLGPEQREITYDQFMAEHHSRRVIEVTGFDFLSRMRQKVEALFRGIRLDVTHHSVDSAHDLNSVVSNEPVHALSPRSLR